MRRLAKRTLASQSPSWRSWRSVCNRAATGSHSLGVLLLLQLLALTALTAAERCNYTVWDALSARSSNFQTVLRLGNSEYGIKDFLSNLDRAITVFALTDASFIDTLSNGHLGDSHRDEKRFLDLLAAEEPLYNSIALYNILPNGAWDADDLVNVGSDLTGLSEEFGAEYDLMFGRGPQDEVVVFGLFPYNATIIDSVETCNGYLHITSRLLFPGNSLQELPRVDHSWDNITGLWSCADASLYANMLEDAVLQEHAVEIFSFFPGYVPLLNRTVRGSVFLPTKQSVQRLREQHGDDWGASFNETRTLLYSSIARAHCPSDMIVPEAKQTCLGDKEGVYFPLGFTLLEDGKIKAWAPQPDNSSGLVQIVQELCQAQVYLYDGWITPDGLHPEGYVLPPYQQQEWQAGGEQGAENRTLVASDGLFIPAVRCEYPVTTRVLGNFSAYVDRRIDLEEVGTNGDVASSSSVAGHNHNDESGVSAVVIAVPVAVVSALLLLLLAALLAVLWHRHRTMNQWLSGAPRGGGGGRLGKSSRRGGGIESSCPGDEDEGDEVSSVATEELVAAIATGGTAVAKSDSWLRNQASMYKRTARVALPTPKASSMYPGESSSTAFDSDNNANTPSLTPCTSGFANCAFPRLGAPAPDALPWEIAAEELELCRGDDGQPECLGYGSSAKVFKGLRGGFQDVAIKVLNRVDTTATTVVAAVAAAAASAASFTSATDVRDLAAAAAAPPPPGAKGDNGEHGGGGNGDAVAALAAAVLNAGSARGSFDLRSGQLRREISLLKDLRDRNIVQFYGACVSDEVVMLVTEYLAGGDLYHVLQDKERAAEYTWAGRGSHVALDIARGLAYLHSRKVVHLDLKSANILLAADGTAKLADMGLAQVLHPEGTMPEEHGTYAWAAPELLCHMRLTEQADIYSFGVVLWELVTHEEPRRGRMRPVVAPDECPLEIKDLMESCLRVIPTERPSAKQAFDIIRRSNKEHSSKERR